MRLIDADLLEKAAERTKQKTDHYADHVALDYAVKLANMLPTVDAVQVVRCRDCKHSAENDGKLVHGARYCKLAFDGSVNNFDSVWDTDFCSDGERKDKKGNG